MKKLLWRIRSARRDPFADAKLSVIAHSFGTYAIGRILKENPDIRLHRLVLCGAVLPTDFRWDQIPNSVRTDIINDCGIRDIWPVLAQSTTFGYGPSGRFGFGTPGVRDRFHNFGHGGFFEEKFVREFWLPWFRIGHLVNSEAPPPSGTPWHLLTIIQIKWLAIAILLCAAGWFALASIPKDTYKKPPQTSKTEDVGHAAVIPSSLQTNSPPKTATLIPTQTPTPDLARAELSETPGAILAEDGELEIVFKFELYNFRPGDKLIFQVASDKAFSDILKRETLSARAGSAVIKMPDPGREKTLWTRLVTLDSATGLATPSAPMRVNRGDVKPLNGP